MNYWDTFEYNLPVYGNWKNEIFMTHRDVVIDNKRSPNIVEPDLLINFIYIVTLSRFKCGELLGPLKTSQITSRERKKGLSDFLYP